MGNILYGLHGTFRVQAARGSVSALGMTETTYNWIGLQEGIEDYLWSWNQSAMVLC